MFDRSGESIQQESVPAGRRLKVLLYELHDHLITDLQGHKNSSLSSNNILALYIYFMSIQNLFIQQQEMDIKVHKYEQTAPNCESQTDGRKITPGTSVTCWEMKWKQRALQQLHKHVYSAGHKYRGKHTDA